MRHRMFVGFRPDTGGGIAPIAIGAGGKFIFGVTTGGDMHPPPDIFPPTEIVSVGIAPDGTLSPANKPVMLDVADLAVSGNFLFAVGAQGVWVYKIDPSTGALVLAHESPFALNGRGGLLQVDTSGKFLYVATTSDSQGKSASGLAAFLIDPASGTLTPVAGSPFSVPEATGGLTTSLGPSH